MLGRRLAHAGVALVGSLPVSDGYLRRSVRITRAAGVVSLSHAFWTLDLPAAWVGTAPGISALLNRRACVHDLPSADPEVQGVVALLKAQRCLSYPDDHDVYTLAQARELFKEEFYARVSARYGLDGFFRNWESHV